MDATDADLAAVRRGLQSARDSLVGGSGKEGGDGSPDPAAPATAVERLLDAVGALANLVEAAGEGADRARDTGVVDDTTPPGGPTFDRARPRRGYGRGE